MIDNMLTFHTDFNIHTGLKRVLDGRRKMEEENSFDWGVGEMIAFGSLLLEGSNFIYTDL